MKQEKLVRLGVQNYVDFQILNYPVQADLAPGFPNGSFCICPQVRGTCCRRAGACCCFACCCCSLCLRLCCGLRRCLLPALLWD